MANRLASTAFGFARLAKAPTRLMPMASQNTIIRPWWNGPEIRFGKNECPVSVAEFCGGREDSTFVPSSCCIGL